ncbi:gliding motility-associated C-terminal domain-containing protein [Aquirufa sp. ROCK2-A2]
MYQILKLSFSWTKCSVIGLIVLWSQSFQSYSQAGCPWVSAQEKIVLIGGDPPNPKAINPVITNWQPKDVTIPVNGSRDPKVVWKWEELSEISGLLIPPLDSLNTLFKFSDSRFSPENLNKIYSLKFKVTGVKEGCVNPATAEVIIKVLPRIHPYNVMTPNTDAANDVWMIENITDKDIYSGVIIKIFDRWGQQVFTSKGNKPQFDATVNPYKLPTGTYVYSIKPEEDYPEVVGELTIIR